MHSTSMVSCDDFQFRTLNGEWTSNLDDFCPAFSLKDRFAFVSPQLEDGIQHAGIAILALVQHFYRLSPHADEAKCTYPDWLCLLQHSDQGFLSERRWMPASKTEAGAAWGNLDIFPEDRWRSFERADNGILAQLKECGATRVFAPFGVLKLPESTSMHKTQFPESIKTVWFYGAESSNCCVRGTNRAVALIQRSLRIVESLHKKFGTVDRGTGAELSVEATPGTCCLWRFDRA